MGVSCLTTLALALPPAAWPSPTPLWDFSATYAELGTRAYTPYRGHMFEWFVQDSWKVRPNLRLEFGLRHSIIQPYYSLWRNIAFSIQGSTIPARRSLRILATGYIVGTTGDRYNGIGDSQAMGFLRVPKDVFPSQPQENLTICFAVYRRSIPRFISDDFQPRFGIAYSLNEKTVVRAGAGRFMTRLGVSDSVFLGGNPPFQPTSSVTNGSVDAPGGASSVNFPLIITTQDRTSRTPRPIPGM